MSSLQTLANNPSPIQATSPEKVFPRLPLTTDEIRSYFDKMTPEMTEACHRAASEMHENWCRGWEATNGAGIPREKPIKGTDPRALELLAQGVTTQNINCPYDELLPEFKEFNFQSARFDCGLLMAVRKKALACHPSVFYELVHRDWLDRSPYAHSGPLDVPWCWLPKVEQDKDVEVFNIGVKHLRAVVDN
jgi:hypothetical protein